MMVGTYTNAWLA